MNILHSLAHHLGGFAFLASILLLLVPLAGALGGALVSWLIAGQNVYVNSITAERSKWLDKLRINFSDYTKALGSVTALVTKGEKSDEEHRIETQQAAIELIRLSSLLRLQLNPDGKIDGNVISLLNSITHFSPDTLEPINDVHDLLILHMQWLLKAEWEKVKWEAGGFFYRRKHRKDEAQRLDRYEKFCRENGSVDAALMALRNAQTTTENLMEIAKKLNIKPVSI